MSNSLNLKVVQECFDADFLKSLDRNQIEELRIHYLGKKSIVSQSYSKLKELNVEERKNVGQEINSLRNYIAEKLDEKLKQFENEALNQKLKSEYVDLTETTRQYFKGSIHPLNKVVSEIELIFKNFGFEFEEGGEIEDDFHNFTALNMSKNHPARQMQDTFYLKNSELLLRTHTSNTQIHKLTTSKPPIKVCSIGRVFRRDFDQTHTPMFHQLEGFVLNQNVSMLDLRVLLEDFLAKFFENKNLKLRFRPSFFPFTEPSAEVDINYGLKNEHIKIGEGDSFLEILGCGMIHPQVLRNCNIDPEKFRGFAFGVGIERLAMLKYGITDLRMFFEGDVRFLKHYGFKQL